MYFYHRKLALECQECQFGSFNRFRYYCSRMLIALSVIAAIVSLGLGAYLTNPFNRLTFIRRPYVAEMIAGAISAIDNNQKLVIEQRFAFRLFAILKNGIHIVSSRWVKSPRSTSKNVDDIIRDIYALRFDPNKLLLTTGDHFSALFVRNLGVFYYPVLDRSIPTAKELWHDRQIVYLQTLAYALGVFAKQKTLTTTIVPTGRYQATCVNFYAYPSDTLYGMLYALAALQGIESAQPASYGKRQHLLDTKAAAEILTGTYRDSLKAHYARYKETAFDNTTGLIKTNLHMSGAKDITRRESSFYDNVIFWKTTQLAGKLSLIEHDGRFLRQLKQRIIKTFWLDDDGYFLEDLSREGIEHKYYSSDWLIVLATGFLSPENEDDRQYFERSIDYIQKHKIDHPFAIKYQHETRAHRQFLAVRLAVASYGGDSIWSFWGMEYIKCLLLLYRSTGKIAYLKTADQHIEKYKKNMVRDGGFPEVYDNKGALLETPLYRSVRQAGWVIGFEQVLAIRETLK